MADLLTYLYFLHFVDDPGNSNRGKRLFSELGCARCHGLDGKPGDIMHIDLSSYQKAGNPMEFVTGMWNHSSRIESAMKEKGIRWPRFRKGDLPDLLEFVRTWKR
jgi:hypothetical protein